MKKFIWLTALLLVGCTTAMPTAPPSTSTATTDEPATRVTPNPQPTEIFQCCMDSIVSTGTLAEDETFLNAIDSAIDESRAEQTPPVEQRYIEFREAGSDLLFQGQVLIYAEEACTERVLVQPAQSGAAHLIDMRTCPGFDPATFNTNFAQALAELAAPLSQTPPPDASVDFVRAERASDGTWSFAVTISHPDTGWDDYADGWHIEAGDGTILGTRILLHPHENEQPFTRSLGGVTIDDSVDEVFVRSHDLISGYGSNPLRVPLAEAGSGEHYEVVR